MLQRICNACLSLLILTLAILAGLLLVPRLLGYQSLAVLSGSMEPKLKVGSIVLTKEADVENIEEGDVITYRLSENTMVTHRVTKVDKIRKEFTTKGDANNSEDIEKVPFQNVVGKVTGSILGLGYLSIYGRTPLGVAAVCGIVLVLILLLYLPEILEGDSRPDMQRKEKLE